MNYNLIITFYTRVLLFLHHKFVFCIYPYTYIVEELFSQIIWLVWMAYGKPLFCFRFRGRVIFILGAHYTTLIKWDIEKGLHKSIITKRSQTWAFVVLNYLQSKNKQKKTYFSLFNVSLLFVLWFRI